MGKAGGWRHFDFLPGEREIRGPPTTCASICSIRPVLRNAEVLPLFSRLSQAEQTAFLTATATASCWRPTWPRPRSPCRASNTLIDAGTARVKRYSFRSKVEQLLVEPISQAAANQRAGRCGRVANGIASACTTRRISTSATALPTGNFAQFASPASSCA